MNRLHMGIAARMSFVALAILAGSTITLPASAQQPAACDQSALPLAEYYACESAQLRLGAARLAAEANSQMSQGGSLSNQCDTMEDSTDMGNCDLLSSDIIIDAAFKQAEAADMMQEAARMDARAADLRDPVND